jgi:hypothetical protein
MNLWNMLIRTVSVGTTLTASGKGCEPVRIDGENHLGVGG